MSSLILVLATRSWSCLELSHQLRVCWSVSQYAQVLFGLLWASTGAVVDDATFSMAGRRYVWVPWYGRWLGFGWPLEGLESRAPLVASLGRTLISSANHRARSGRVGDSTSRLSRYLRKPTCRSEDILAMSSLVRVIPRNSACPALPCLGNVATSARTFRANLRNPAMSELWVAGPCMISLMDCVTTLSGRPNCSNRASIARVYGRVESA